MDTITGGSNERAETGVAAPSPEHLFLAAVEAGRLYPEVTFAVAVPHQAGDSERLIEGLTNTGAVSLNPDGSESPVVGIQFGTGQGAAIIESTPVLRWVEAGE